MGVEHWERIYETKADEETSWFEPDPATSLRLVEEALEGNEAACVIDVGGGTSRLVDHLLLDLGLECLAVLDISASALARASERLGSDASRVEWIASDITEVDSLPQFDVWHDRAVLHFLIDQADRAKYSDLAGRTVPLGGHAIIAAFGLSGPEQCSGLPVQRYDEDGLSQVLGSSFSLDYAFEAEHLTPFGTTQSFIFATFERV